MESSHVGGSSATNNNSNARSSPLGLRTLTDLIPAAGRLSPVPFYRVANSRSQQETKASTSPSRKRARLASGGGGAVVMGSGGGGGESRTTPSPPLLSAPQPVVAPSPHPRERENHNPHVGGPGVPGDRERRRHSSRSSARCVPR